MQSFFSRRLASESTTYFPIEALEPRAYFSVDLSATVTFISPASGQAKPGQAITARVVVTNNGTTVAKGPLLIDLGVSATSDGATPFALPTKTKSIKLAAGASVTLKLPTKAPSGLTPGAYFATATIDPANTFAETTLANNFAVSTAPLTILSAFPNIAGTYTGTIDIVSGVHKGVSFQTTAVYAVLDPATGTFSETATFTFSDGSTSGGTGTGTITTKGVIAEDEVDVPADALGTSVNKAKLTGNVIKGTFVDLEDHGKYTFTR
jgi:hypothetical protein